MRCATSEKWFAFASQILNKMYGWRGYGSGFRMHDQPDQMTFVATDSDSGNAVGTLTVGLDQERGIQADRLYGDITGEMRAQGQTICEFTKLAVDHSVKSKLALGALFHVAVIYAHAVRRCDALVIEINPGHESFYERLLHFERCGNEVLNPRVNAPSILMRQTLEHISGEALRYGGQGRSSGERSLYPFFLSPRDAALARARMLSREESSEVESHAPQARMELAANAA